MKDGGHRSRSSVYFLDGEEFLVPCFAILQSFLVFSPFHRILVLKKSYHKPMEKS